MNQKLISFQTKLFLALALVTFLAALLPPMLLNHKFYEERLELAKEQALLHCRLLGATLQDMETGNLNMQSVLATAQANDLRITVTDPSGKVIIDSDLPDEQLPQLDNHNDRPEIEAAKLTGEGVSLRLSNNTGKDSIYAATRLADNTIVRVAVPFSAVQNDFKGKLSSLVWTAAWVILLCLLLSIFLTKRMRKGISAMTEAVQSISLGNYQNRLHIVPGSEFVPLADAVNRMAENIDRQITTATNEQVELETVLNSLYEGVLVIDRQGKVTRHNRSLEKMFPDMAVGAGKQVIESIPLPGLQSMLEAILAPTPDVGLTEEMRQEFELADGRTITAYVSRPAQSGTGLGAVAVLSDASKLMRLERVRKDFISNVSHELRTPLTAIASSAEILLEAPEIPAAFKKFPNVIHKHATALSRLITDLLELSRLENGQETFSMETLELSTALTEAIAPVNEQLQKKQLKLNLEDWAPIRVTGRSSLITQVLANLLNNAERYAPVGSVIKIFNYTKGNQAIIGIADQGPGIPAAELERIFERFYQVEKGRTGTGTGIGLAISKHIIERHHGKIWAESPYMGFSTAFFFSLPLEGA